MEAAVGSARGHPAGRRRAGSGVRHRRYRHALSARGATTTALDITPRMLELAAAKRPGTVQPRWVAGDMMALPFGAARFDVVTTGYGIRNVPVLPVALAKSTVC